MSKRGHEEDEAVEVYAALLRQSGARAVERIRQRRGGGVLPIDALVIRYAIWYLDTRAFPPFSYVTQAQRVISEAIGRVSHPQHYTFVPLPALVESLVAENTAEVMQQTISQIEEFIDARDALGRWLDENTGGVADYAANDEDEYMDTAVDLAATLWRSALFWVAVLEYIEALSLSSAKVNAFALRPKYEHALMQLLNSIAAPRVVGYWRPIESAIIPSVTGADGGALSASADPFVKGEAIKEITEEVAVAAPKPDSHHNAESTRAFVVSRLLADLTALTNIPGDSPVAAGINATFYSMVHARLNVLAACDHLDRFSTTAAVPPPPLTPSLQALQAQRDACARGRLRREAERMNRDDIGVPLDFVPNESYMRAALEKNNDTLGEDEELFKDEIVDYYKNHPQSVATKRRNDVTHTEKSKVVEEPVTLVKPHRFCKVKTGYTWTQYNRTHYDSRTNPPPRSVLWYEFTLFYPALANTKQDMSRIYHIENTTRGPNDDYCILVFSVGPPYADVAYQIVRKQWDPRPGGVRASFDSTGTYRLFFRFTNSNYRR
ncbi:hypothetical protein TraAM80_06619 [Trypanosoma rangeli]|uniref:Splicing factor Cactin C-terminal domain-containing protein n=1 Tax=Trypanosoma rangeli TaxID=5698 RepID=A0A422N9D9_TRYRA|nr:uncharacterized protein TraAM80_06619 [Trypanosoma rangeli]RNF02075.1 hypothetical protein TraAM80_06619 [Trypanosoma rangeli]|eukprot:RNF02075.1 hypothetical protein TraAM80_06619 [Trypanosoma rangeli]